MTGDRGNDRDNRKIVGLGCPGRNIYITTQFLFYFFCVYGKPLFTIQSVKQMKKKKLNQC